MKLDKLLDQYKEKFNEDIELPMFWLLKEEEQIKILEECIKNNQRLFECDYFNDNYMEIVM